MNAVIIPYVVEKKAQEISKNALHLSSRLEASINKGNNFLVLKPSELKEFYSASCILSEMGIEFTLEANHIILRKKVN